MTPSHLKIQVSCSKLSTKNYKISSIIWVSWSKQCQSGKFPGINLKIWY